MYFYQVKLVLKENNLDEFIDCLNSLSTEFQKETGYLDFSYCQDIEKDKIYNLIGKWKTRQAIEKHFKYKNFTVLIGAARVLGEDMEIYIGKSEEIGGFQLANDKIALQPNEDHCAGK